MRKPRHAFLAGIVLAAVLLLSACSGGSAKPASSSSPTPIDKGGYIGQEIDPVGTSWSGTDSGGDLTSFTLHEDHTVAVGYGTEAFDEPGDTWTVVNGTLELHVFIDPANGMLDYTGRYDPAAEVIAATATTSLTAKTLTVTLARK